MPLKLVSMSIFIASNHVESNLNMIDASFIMWPVTIENQLLGSVAAAAV